MLLLTEKTRNFTWRWNVTKLCRNFFYKDLIMTTNNNANHNNDNKQLDTIDMFNDHNYSTCGLICMYTCMYVCETDILHIFTSLYSQNKMITSPCNSCNLCLSTCTYSCHQISVKLCLFMYAFLFKYLKMNVYDCVTVLLYECVFLTKEAT